MKKPKPIKWRKGWSRALSVDSDKPVTLPPAPWEIEEEDSK